MNPSEVNPSEVNQVSNLQGSYDPSTNFEEQDTCNQTFQIDHTEVDILLVDTLNAPENT